MNVVWRGFRLPTDGWILFDKLNSDWVSIQKVNEDGSKDLSEEVLIPKKLLRSVVNIND